VNLPLEKVLTNPIALRMGLLLLVAVTGFLFGWYAIRRLRKNLAIEPDSAPAAPLGVEGLPVHAYHAVIQELKQQKHELAVQHMSERRKAKASDTLSSTILSNLSCGVLFLNSNGLVRQANPAARQILGFASPVGLHTADLLRMASLRPVNDGSRTASSLEQALAPALAGNAAVRGLQVHYITRSGEHRILEVNASPVLAEDASLMGTTLVFTDQTDMERIRHDQQAREETSSKFSGEMRHSLTKIAGYAHRLACNEDASVTHELAESISSEAAQLDRALAGLLGDARAAGTVS
jgi:nitrogen fixation/metabolism regulation signal transduction histidine kinase